MLPSRTSYERRSNGAQAKLEMSLGLLGSSPTHPRHESHCIARTLWNFQPKRFLNLINSDQSIRINPFGSIHSDQSIRINPFGSIHSKALREQESELRIRLKLNGLWYKVRTTPRSTHTNTPATIRSSELLLCERVVPVEWPPIKAAASYSPRPAVSY